jgi:putative transposase
MRKTRHSEEQIIRVLQEVESGGVVKEVCREHGISEGTYYRWKSKFGGMSVSEARRLKELELENRRLKAAVADLTLREQALKDALSRNVGGCEKPRIDGC